MQISQVSYGGFEVAQATVIRVPISNCRTFRSVISRTAAGFSATSVYARRALFTRPMITAAFRPWPPTSPTTSHTTPDGKHEGVVPIPTDRSVLRRNVAAGHPQAGHGWQTCRLKAPLEQSRGRALHGELAGERCRCDSFRRDLQQFRVGGDKGSFLEPTDMQDTDQLVVAQQRRPQHDPDPFFPQDRVGDGRRVHAAQEHRLSALGDGAGESGADGNGDTLSNLVFQTHRRSSDQHVGARLDQQHSCRVGFQDGPDPPQQLGKQILQIQLRQRSVGQRQQITQLSTVS